MQDMANMFYKVFNKKTGLGVKANFNEELVQKSHKPVIKKFK